jgi:hypothetical protein
MRLRVLKVTCAGGIAPSDGAFLEMSFQDVTTRECILAEMALIRPLTRICKTLASYVHRQVSTYDVVDDVSDASNADMFYCNGDIQTFRQRSYWDW